MRLLPYPEYKDSGLSWLGDIPSHWDARPLRRIARVQLSNVDKHTFEEETPVLLCNYTDVYKKTWITPRLSFMKASASEAEIRKFALRQGDVLVTKDSETWTDIAIPAYVAEDTPGVLCGYHLAQIRCHENVMKGEYLFRAFQSTPIAYQYHISANGVTRYALSGDAIASGVFPVPPADEQAAIVRFLEHIDRRVNRLLRAKRRLIELLNEQKQALIHRAVTQGLYPDVPKKPTGIDWLGDIPAHWEVQRLKYICNNINEQNIDFNTKEMYIALENIESWSSNFTSSEGDIKFDSAVKRFLPGDILFGKLRPYLAKVFLAVQKGVCVSEFLVLRTSGHVINTYLKFGLISKPFIDAVNSSTFGARMPRANWQFISSMMFPIPPYSEQIDIVCQINRRTATIDSMITNLKLDINLLHEYRLRLISDTVTGKTDVRDAVANLPFSESADEWESIAEEMEEDAGTGEEVEGADDADE